MILGEDQEKALSLMKNFIKERPSPCFVIKGSAGTGKSYTMKHLIDYLEDERISYCLCAPTHKATLVIERYTEREAVTLHKLLQLSPNLDIFELDFNNLLFKIGDNRTDIPHKGIVIVDEASMINDDLYKLLIEKCAERDTLIIAFMDEKQLAPVKQERLSKITNCEPQFTLTKIYRQSDENGVLSSLETLRQKPIDRFDTSIGNDGKLVVTENISQFLKVAKLQFERAIKNSDILETKIAAFTNDRVAAYNNKLHKIIAGEDKEYVKGEFLTCGENLDFNNFKFFNSMDYVIITEPTKIDLHIPLFGRLPAYRLELYDSLDKNSANISILSREISKDYFEALACKIEEFRLQAVEIGRKSKFRARNYWKNYYEMINSFTSPINMFYDNRLIRKKSFDYGYACTAHRLQGSTLNNILVDMKNINACKDNEMRRQLQYVALSRTRKNAVIFQ